MAWESNLNMNPYLNDQDPELGVPPGVHWGSAEIFRCEQLLPVSGGDVMGAVWGNSWTLDIWIECWNGSKMSVSQPQSVYNWKTKVHVNVLVWLIPDFSDLTKPADGNWFFFCMYSKHYNLTEIMSYNSLTGFWPRTETSRKAIHTLRNRRKEEGSRTAEWGDETMLTLTQLKQLNILKYMDERSWNFPRSM